MTTANTNDGARKTTRLPTRVSKRKTSPPVTKASRRRGSDNPPQPLATPPARAASSKTAPAIDPHTTKKQVCLALLGRSEGASINELMLATGWQTHSVRGFLSGEVRKRMGRVLLSTVVGEGARRYSLGETTAAS